MKKYRFSKAADLYPATLLKTKILLNVASVFFRKFDCKFYVANFRKAIFKSTFSRATAMAFSEMIQLTTRSIYEFFSFILL